MTITTPVIDPAVYGTTTWVHLNCVDCGPDWMDDEPYWPTVTDAYQWLAEEARRENGIVQLTAAGLMLCRGCAHKRQCLANGHTWAPRTTPCRCGGADHDADIPCESHDTSPGDDPCLRCNSHGTHCSWAHRTCGHCFTREPFDTAVAATVPTA